MLPLPDDCHFSRYTSDDADKGDDIDRNNILLNITSFADVANDFVIFTHAPLLAFSSCKVDLLQEFVNLYPGKANIGRLNFSLPIFDGFDDISWSNTIFFCEKNCWNDLFRYLAAAAFVDRDTRIVGRADAAPLKIPDYALIEYKGVKGLSNSLSLNYEMVVFRLDANDAFTRISWLGVRRKDGVYIPSAIRSNPNQSTVVWASEILDNKLESLPDFETLKKFGLKGNFNGN